MPVFNTSDIVATGLTVSGSTILSGNTLFPILSISGDTSEVFRIDDSDNTAATLFSVATNTGTSIFSVLTGGTRFHTNIYDINNSTGTTINQILTNSNGGLLWANSGVETVEKRQNQSRASNSTTTNDSELFFTLRPNTFYGFEFWVTGYQYANSDFKFRVSFTGGTLNRVNYNSWWKIGSGTTTTTAAILTDVTTDTQILTASNGDFFLNAKGGISIGANGGTFAFSWAQVTPNTPATIVYAGSYGAIYYMT